MLTVIIIIWICFGSTITQLELLIKTQLELLIKIGGKKIENMEIKL